MDKGEKCYLEKQKKIQELEARITNTDSIILDILFDKFIYE